jgi:O-acetyl-ADP-ribose deacetylase (regulator of RNase III)
MSRELLAGTTRLTIVPGDITKQVLPRGSAIVNAANSALAVGGGVCGAIHRAGGPVIAETCLLIGRCNPGDAKVTTAGALQSNGIAFVIHTVAPVWWGGTDDEATKLRSCYRRCFEEAMAIDARSIAFPALGTASYRYPIEPATAIALSETRAFVAAHPRAFDEIRFVTFSDADTLIYEAAFARA